MPSFFSWTATWTPAPTIRGGIARYLDGVPAGNMLYLPPVGDPAAQSAYAAFFPQTQVAGGNGACLLAMSDTTQYYSGDRFQFYASIRGKTAPALFAALQAPGGACGLPAASVTKSFAPATVALGGGATLTIRLNNLSNPAMSLTGAQVQDVLPAPLVIGGTITRSCTGGTLTGAVGGQHLGALWHHHSHRWLQRDRASALALRGRRGELPGRRAHHSYQHHHATGAVLDRPGPIDHASHRHAAVRPHIGARGAARRRRGAHAARRVARVAGRRTGRLGLAPAARLTRAVCYW